MPSRKGSPNKVHATAKENLIAVFTRLGGTAAMATWAQDNLTEFYKLYGRLIPTDVNLRGRDGEALPGVIMLPPKETIGHVDPHTQASRIPKLDS